MLIPKMARICEVYHDVSKQDNTKDLTKHILSRVFCYNAVWFMKCMIFQAQAKYSHRI